MELFYPGKRSKEDILNSTPVCKFSGYFNNENILIKGENLNVLQALLKNYNFKNKIDLIYIDPPFATNTVFTIGKDRVSTISMSNNDEIAYNDTLRGYAFINFIRERLIIAKELLSEQGSIYLHIDYKIGHYIKIVMDEVFGIENF
jgi:adenine-specific DNA-methyltransferase